MNKTAYMRGFVKYAALNSARFYRRTLPYAVGFGGLGIGLGGIGISAISGLHTKRIKDAFVQLSDIKSDAQKAASNAVHLTEQAKPVLNSAKQLLALAKDKVNSFDVNTVGKYALGGAGIIGGSILLGNLLSASKKKRKKDQDQEQEA